MLSKLLEGITRLSLRFRWVTLALTVAVLAAGIYSATTLKLELLPSFEFPQTIVIAQWQEAEDAQGFLEEVTIPLEDALGVVDGVVNVESTTTSALGIVIVRSEFGLNQDRVNADIEAAIAGTDLPEEMEKPQLLNFSFSDLPVVIASVSAADLTLAELRAIVEEDLQPLLEEVADVSEVGISGGQELPTEDDAAAVGTDEEVAEAPSPEPTAAPTPTPEPAGPAPLPALLVEGAAQMGLELTSAADITPDLMRQFLALGPQASQILALLTPDNLRELPAESIALLPSDYLATLDSALVAELDDLAADFDGAGALAAAEAEAAAAEAEAAAAEEAAQTDEEAAEADVPDVTPVPLPPSWIEAAAATGLALETTADVTVDVMGGIAGFAPELLLDLTPPMWRAIDPAAAAAALPALPADFDADLLAQLAAIAAAARGEVQAAVDLPASWVEAGASFGLELKTTADATPDVIGGIAAAASEFLAELTPEMILALSPEAQAAIPADFVAGLDEGLQETLTVISIRSAQFAAADTTAAPDETGPSRLPDLLISGAAQFGLTLEFAADLTPDIMRQFASVGPQAAQIFGLLSPENLRQLPPESIALLPPDFVGTLDADLRAELDELADEFGGAGALAAAEADAADPARLPEILIQGAAQAGIELEFAQDVTPDFIRLFASLGEQGNQALALLTPDNLRLLDPEVIALLPAGYLDTLDPELRAELDALAAEYGGAGMLAIAEAEAAEAAAAGAPLLTGVWTEPGPDGSPPLFKNAADILNNAFTGSAASFINFLPDSPNVQDPSLLLGDLSLEVITYLAENEADFAANLNPIVVELFNAESILYLLDTYPNAFDAETTDQLRGVAAGDIEVFIPEASITRTNGNPSLIVSVYKDGDANTVSVAEEIFTIFDEFEESHPGVSITLAFEQATFIEDSINGVSREGLLGAAFAILIILIFLSGRVNGRYRLSWRSTIITGVSIPLSIFAAFLFMRWVPASVGVAVQDFASSSDSSIVRFLAQLFPAELTLNIMTLSGLTVAIGRVVDDSIVVMENIYRFIQQGEEPYQAAVKGTKEVAIAIFSSTVTTMGVFLPLGLVGGIIGQVFMPFGLTVAWALAASYVVSITVVPVLAMMLIRRENLPDHAETSLQRYYTPLLEWCLNHRFVTMAVATAIFVASLFLLTQLPQSFIPGFGEPTINTSIELPPGTTMAETDAKVREFEESLADVSGLETYQIEVGSGGGFEALFGGGGVSQNVANVTVTTSDPDDLNPLTNEVRQKALSIFGDDNATVSAASQTGFSGFSLIVTGESAAQVEEIVEDVRKAIGMVDIDGDGLPDIANVSSNLDQAALGGTESIIRIDGRPAVSFAGDLETTNTLGVTSAAKEAIVALPSVSDSIEVTEGFDSEQQVQGFRGMITAIGWSILVVYFIMALTFRSFIHPFTILFSLPFALVGASIALYITNSVLGISALIGLMMLVGIVVTNAIVLLELVQQLRERGLGAYEALVEGGRTRLRPILMTALTAILALIPLAASTEAGALIASELARAVMGGLIVSTALTLVVVPIVYSVFDDLIGWFRSRRSSAA